MIIIGAGMAGLLAAAMMRGEATQLIEARDRIPNNHSAVLRFRTKAVGDVLNVPFKQVTVLKAVHEWRNPVADAMGYSFKTNGTGTLRSILSANGNTDQRYIAPPDLIQQMVNRCTCDFKMSTRFTSSMAMEYFGAGIPVISTMPMHVLMGIVGWEPKSTFRYRAGVNLVARLENVDAYCSLYVPSPEYPFYRISITGDELIAEMSDSEGSNIEPEEEQELLDLAAWMVGISPRSIVSHQLHQQSYAKILPIDEQERQRFILYATEQLGIYSLGRFATWRPGLLLDDVVNDVRVIQRLADGQSSYEYRKEV